MSQPKILNAGEGWVPGNPQMEPIIHSWSTYNPS